MKMRCNEMEGYEMGWNEMEGDEMGWIISGQMRRNVMEWDRMAMG